MTRLQQNGGRYFFYELPRALVPIVYESTYTPRYGPRIPVPWALALPLLALILAGAMRAARRLPLTAAVGGALDRARACSGRRSGPGCASSCRSCPLLTLFLLHGLWERSDGSPEPGMPRPGVATAAAVAALLVLERSNLVRYVRETRDYPPPWRVYFEAVEWAGRPSAEGQPGHRSQARASSRSSRACRR